MKPKRILIALDLSEGAEEVLDEGLSLARTFGAEVQVLHVWRPPTWVAPDVMLAVPGWSAASLEEHAVGFAAKQLEALLDEVDPSGLDVKARIEVGRPASEILRVAAEEHIELVVLGTHGRTGLNRLLLGSVAQEVVTKADCPVLTTRRGGGERVLLPRTRSEPTLHSKEAAP